MDYQRERNEQALNKIMERGRMAELLLSIPEFHRFFDEVREDYYRNFSLINPTEPDEVLAYQHQAHALIRVQQKAELYVAEAKAEMERRNQN
ncbi:hypothetical protein [Brucella rhizosphaerae]|uniref:Uncharacterized protein n=1 Tax=Brucella rhizosphaerae TaxID=571254 RepID=A0A256F8H1_9HYPH|nr:hypothetical protein [Brucella rhizosphaerae]OYR11179.1 hypothetical protein CEV32_1477 [Brucella rhizosphaerae]